MIGSLGDDFAFFVLMIAAGMILAALAGVVAVGVVVAAAIQRTEPSIRRAFAAGTFLVPVAGVLVGLGLDARGSSAPSFFGAALVAVVAAVAGVVTSGRIAGEHQRPAPLDQTTGIASLGVATLVAVVAALSFWQ